MTIEEKKLGEIDSVDLANYILYRGGAMSHLKLQKLLFYTQAYHLAYFDAPIIEDDFQAWVHGPVSRKIFDQAKGISILHTEFKFVLSEGETPPDVIMKSTLTESQLDLVNDVIDGLKGLSGLQLENMTHSEHPWNYARRGYDLGERCEAVIPKNLIREFYKKQMYGKS